VAAGDPSVVGFALSLGVKAAGVIAAYSGVDPVNPIDVSGVQVNASGASHMSPSVVTSGASRLGVTIVGVTAVSTMNPPVGSTERADQAGAAGALSASVELSDFGLPSAGASGSRVTGSAVAGASVAATLALRPAPGGPGPITYSRYYRFAGETVGMRQGTSGGPSDVLQWLAGNHQGSTSVAIAAGSGVAIKNRYLPYGGLRGTDNMVTTDHGFLGQVEDAATGLDYLNNRYLDPTLGRFISVDPLVSSTRDAYGYSRNSPVTFSDPTGLDCVVHGGCDYGQSSEEQQYRDSTGHDGSKLWEARAAAGSASGSAGGLWQELGMLATTTFRS
jgi:RHS repeat-associated protein